MNTSENEKGTEPLDRDHEEAMGNWVRDRCRLRTKHPTNKRMPDHVAKWLDEGGNSPADEKTKPTLAALAWLVGTIIDPDWDG